MHDLENSKKAEIKNKDKLLNRKENAKNPKQRIEANNELLFADALLKISSKLKEINYEPDQKNPPDFHILTSDDLDVYLEVKTVVDEEPLEIDDKISKLERRLNENSIGKPLVIGIRVIDSSKVMKMDIKKSAKMIMNIINNSLLSEKETIMEDLGFCLWENGTNKYSGLENKIYFGRVAKHYQSHGKTSRIFNLVKDADSKTVPEDKPYIVVILGADLEHEIIWGVSEGYPHDELTFNTETGEMISQRLIFKNRIFGRENGKPSFKKISGILYTLKFGKEKDRTKLFLSENPTANNRLDKRVINILSNLKLNEK